MAAVRAMKPALPPDVRLMNAVASMIFLLVLAGLLVLAARWASQLPLFELRVVEVAGEVERSTAAEIRATAAPQLKGNFFSLDLQAAREAFEAVPWVRQAVLHRVFPNKIEVRLVEHRAAAVWIGEDGNDRLVSTLGEVFEANVGDVEDEGLPEFDGPQDAAGAMLSLHRRLAPLFEGIDARIRRLELSRRGSWRAALDGGAVVELGRGSEDELLQRVTRFVSTLPQVTGHYQRPLRYADLRHAEAYAVRLHGISTTLPAVAAPRKK